MEQKTTKQSETIHFFYISSLESCIFTKASILILLYYYH